MAEAFDFEGNLTQYEPGDVLVISDGALRSVALSSEPNSRLVVGVYATKPGVLLSSEGIEADLTQKIPLGILGVIPTKVSDENGSISTGDLLVTGSIPGHAMKAEPVVLDGIEIWPTGAILGKALEPFNGPGAGVIEVLVNVK